MRRSGSRVRIAVQLINASDGLGLWSERYDYEVADIFAMQDEIAFSIARALEQTLSGGDARGQVVDGPRRTGRGVVNPEAFELFLRGRHLVEQRAEGMHEGLRCFEQALHLDPAFSAVHAGIGLAFTTLGIYHALRPLDAFPRAREAAERALALDPADALALVVRAHTMIWHEWNFADSGFERIVEKVRPR